MSTYNYDAKKILCLIGMEYRKIHVCLNDFVLYKKKYEKLHQCSYCGLSRYNEKDGDFEFDVRKGVSIKNYDIFL